MDDGYVPPSTNQTSNERVENNNRFSVEHGILPGVHEIIPHSASYSSTSSWDTRRSNVSLSPHMASSQGLYPDLQYRNSVGVTSDLEYQNSVGIAGDFEYRNSVGVASDLEYRNSARLSNHLQYQDRVRVSNVGSNPGPLVYQGERLLYPTDREIPLSLAHPLLHKHEVNYSLFSNRYSQAHQVHAAGPSQWLSNSFHLSHVPGAGYGGGGCIGGGPLGLQLVSTCQTRVLAPIQQPDVQPAPPCFWTDRLKSQSLRPLPRAVSSTLGVGFKPQIHHRVECCSGLSHFKHGVCSDFTVNSPATCLNDKTHESGRYGSHESQLHDVSFVSNAFMPSLAPEYQTTDVHFGQTPSATITVPVNMGQYVDASVNRNILLQYSNVQIDHGKQKIQLDENCNHIYSFLHMTATESLEQKTDDRQMEEKSDDEEETSLDENNLNTSVMEDNLNTSMMEDNLNTSVIEDNLSTSVMEDNLNTSVMDDNLNTTVMDDNLNTTMMDDNLNTSMIEEYIQSAPDFQSLSQIHTDQSQAFASGVDHIAGHTILKETFVKNSSRSLSPQTFDGKSSQTVGNCLGSIESNGSALHKFPCKIRRCEKSHSKLENLAGSFEENVAYSSPEGGMVSVTVACSSSSSSDISPITADSVSSTATHNVSRRRSYRSRNFSKEFCNRWSSFEDVPLTITRQPDCNVLCSTPKKQNTMGELDLIDKEFSCETCGKRFFNHYAYSRHTKKHKVDDDNCQQKRTKSKDIYKCSPCNMTWNNRDQFLFHFRCHSNTVFQSSLTEEPQGCKIKEDKARHDSVSKGQGKNTVEMSSRRCVCSISGNSFSCSYKYNPQCPVHGRTDELMSSNESDSSACSPRYFHCHVCGIKFVNRFMYSKHCVSQQHRINQKRKGSGIPKLNSFDKEVHGKPLFVEPDQMVNLELSSSAKTNTAGNAGQHRYVPEYSTTQHSRRENVQLGLLKKSTKDSFKMSRRYIFDTAKESGVVMSAQHGCPPTSAKYDHHTTDDSYSGFINENNSVPKYPRKRHNLKRSSNSAVHCKRLFLKGKCRNEKSNLNSSHVETLYFEGMKPNDLLENQFKGSCIDATSASVSDTCSCHRSSGSSSDKVLLEDKRMEGPLDENNNPTDVTQRCPEHTVFVQQSSCRFGPTANGLFGFHGDSNVSDDTTNLKPSTTGSLEDASNSGDHLTVSNELKSTVSHSLVCNHHPSMQKTVEMTSTDDVPKLKTVSQLKSAESGMRANGRELRTDDSCLETSCELLLNGKRVKSQNSRNNQPDIDKTSFVDSQKTPKTVHGDLEVQSEMMSNETSTEQEGLVVLKGDSGLWSDETWTSESDVEESMVIGCSRTDALEECNTADGLEENASRSKEVWSIQIMDTSDKSCKVKLDDPCPILEQSGLTEEENVIAFEVKYDATTNSVDLVESIEPADTNNWKIVSEFVNMSSDAEAQHSKSPADHNVAAVAGIHTLSVDDETSKTTDKNCDLVNRPSLPLPSHRSRRAKISSPALLLDGGFHNGKLYFCEICGETFVNPFRYSAHYKKKAHVELASQFGYENISCVGATVPRKVKDKKRKLKALQVETNSSWIKDLETKKGEMIFEEKQRKGRPKHQMCRASLSELNVESSSASQMFNKHKKKKQPRLKVSKVSFAKMSPAVCRKLKRRWSSLTLRSSRLKKMASRSKLKTLKSKPQDASSIHYLRFNNNPKKPGESITKRSCDRKNSRKVGSCGSTPFMNNRELHLHSGSKRSGNISLDEGSGSNSRLSKEQAETGDGSKELNKSKDLMNINKKDKASFKDGQLDEQPFRKRKPTVKCPALLTAASEEFKNVTSRSHASGKRKRVPHKLNRKDLCPRKKHLLVTKNKSGAHSSSSGGRPAEHIGKRRKEDECNINKPDQTESMHLVKKPKFASPLISLVKNVHKKSKSQDVGSKVDASVEQKVGVKSGKNKTLEWDVYCEVCEKFYSSKSHLYRHYKTEIHKQQALEKKKEKKI